MTTAQAESTIPTGSWTRDAIHSHVGFAVKHMVGTFRGDFGEYDISLTNTEGEPKILGSVKVESIKVDDENLQGHLLSPEFFDAERFPEIGFESTKIAREGDQIVVDGKLTIRGETRDVVGRGEITGPAAGPDDKDRLGVDLETKVNRHDFGLDWNADLPGGGKVLGDEVTLTVHLELVDEA
jgi:polyisoprenoid-binding protein YceI